MKKEFLIGLIAILLFPSIALADTTIITQLSTVGTTTFTQVTPSSTITLSNSGGMLNYYSKIRYTMPTFTSSATLNSIGTGSFSIIPSTGWTANFVVDGIPKITPISYTWNNNIVGTAKYP